MSLFGRLFGGGSSSNPPAPKFEEHEGFRIYPEPVSEGGRWRVGARVEKDIGGDLKSHMMIRADVFESQDAAAQTSVAKAKSMIDQLGDSIFQ